MPTKQNMQCYNPADGDNALHTAIRELSLSRVKALLKQDDVKHIVNTKNTSIDNPKSGGDTPLHIAVKVALDKEVTGGDASDALTIVRTLLQHECFKSPLAFCAENAAASTPWDDVYNISPQSKNSSEIFKLLVEHGGSPLLQAVLSGNYYHVVSELFKPGVDVNKTNVIGWSALHVAALMGQRQITKHLISTQNLDYVLRDHWGNTSLQLAAENDHGEVVRLLSRVIPINEADVYGQTPLFGAAWKNCMNALEVILETSGVDVNLPTNSDSGSMTPLYVASRMGNEHVVECLLKVQGINVTQPTTLGKTPATISREILSQEEAKGDDADPLQIAKYTRIIALFERSHIPIIPADEVIQEILPTVVLLESTGLASKTTALKLLRGEEGYTDEDFDSVRSVVAYFYARLNHINSDRQDFHAKVGVPATGLPTQDLTQYDFLGALSRLMYGNDVCVALSFFQGKLLVATNKVDYGDDVLLPNLRTNYNSLHNYIKWIADLSEAAHKPVWVETKLVGRIYVHDCDGLAGTLASSIAAKLVICRKAENVLSQVSQSLQARGGDARDFMILLDTAKPFTEAWLDVVSTIETEYGENSEEAKICRDFTVQHIAESELQRLREFAKAMLGDFFTYKSTHYSGDLVSGWKSEYNAKCPSEFKKIYKDYAKAEIRDFLRDLIIIESFVSHNPDNQLVVTLLDPRTKLTIVDDDGNEVSAKASVFPEDYPQATYAQPYLAIKDLKLGNIHAEMKILQYQLKHGGLSSYIAVSMLCCAFCHLTIDALDQGSAAHYPGYHGQAFELKLSNWMKQNPGFLKQFLGSPAADIFQNVQTHVVHVDGVTTTVGALIFSLIEAMPKLVKESPIGLPTIPKGVAGSSLSADNGFLIDFGIVDSSTLEQQYYSLRTRSFVDQQDDSCLEVQLIGAHQ